MSDNIRFASVENDERNVWAGAAFVVEALVLLVFLAASLAIMMSIFAGAHERGLDNHNMTEAIMLASNAAEEFAYDPTSVPQTSYQGEYTIDCIVESVESGAGILYEATISVSADDEVFYTLTTARYVSEGGQRG